tara:strand:+ start:1741 stop:2289 length:549 start_codon:yes stop_codon:yes gene_type:complete
MTLLGRGKFGVGLTGFAILFLIAGMIGFTFEGEVEGVPTPNAPKQAFFSDEPLPSNPLIGILSTELTLTWDRDDVWIGIVDEAEKDRCDDVPSSFFSDDSDCNGVKLNFEAGEADANADTGFTWEMESGTYFAALGAKDGALPAGAEVNIDYEAHIGHSLLSIVVSMFILGIGATLIYYGRE